MVFIVIGRLSRLGEYAYSIYYVTECAKSTLDVYGKKNIKKTGAWNEIFAYVNPSSRERKDLKFLSWWTIICRDVLSFPSFFAVMRILHIPYCIWGNIFLSVWVGLSQKTISSYCPFKAIVRFGLVRLSSLISLSLVVHQPLTETEQLRVRSAQDISEH